MLGLPVKLGIYLGNFNLGLFLYTVMQMLIVIIINAYTISYSMKEDVNPVMAFAILLMLSFFPTLAFYSITAVKDTLYTCFLLLFTLKIYDIVKKDNMHLQDYISLFLITA